MAASYNGGGKSDWHLPSMDELNQMCKWARGQAWISNETQCNGTGVINTGSGAGAGFVDADGNAYWSSSENTLNNAWFYYFAGGGADGDYGKNSTYYVRPVRAF